MRRFPNLRISTRTHRAIRAVVATSTLVATNAAAQQRLLQPQDLFRVERVGAITWSADRARAAVEIRRPGRWLDQSIPTAQIGIVDAETGRLRIVSSPLRAHLGFFGARWSPAGRRLLFLSLDTTGIVRPWIWSSASDAAELLRGLQLHESLADPPVALWSDDERVILLLRDSSRATNGPLWLSIERGRNAADAWRTAREGKAAVQVVESLAPDTASPAARLVSLDLQTRRLTTLARGAIHRPRVSADGRTVSFRREEPPIPSARVAPFFDPSIQGEAAYDLPNWGGTIVHMDARTGTPVSPPDSGRAAAPSEISASLRVHEDPTVGTTLWLARPGKPDTAVWRGNTWVASKSLGAAEPIRYTSLDGRALTGWLLLPPVPGNAAAPGPRPSDLPRRLPIITVVYPSNVYGERPPRAFSVFDEHFEHPQMFAALGYGVVYASMPEPDLPMQQRGLDALAAGVLPLLDTLIARGIADSTRIAVLGQSAGGYATLGLITQTDRFRTAIASASYANLTSLYGTFYGQYRHGDGGRPLHAQVLRMLQFERGYYGAGAPPWEAPERYRSNSPIERVATVKTPLMLIHGELDFIPIQQAEEFFTALYRRDQRVKLLRYVGEGHTIASRANVLDMWARIIDWLKETMPN
jgi:hypothetical protein